MLKVHEQMRIISKGAAEIIHQEELMKKLLAAAEKGAPCCGLAWILPLLTSIWGMQWC